MGGLVRNFVAATAGATAILLASAASAAPITKSAKTVAHQPSTKAAPTTYVYIPAMAQDGKGYIAEFSIDADGNLAALKPPIVAAGEYPYSVAVDPAGKYCYAALWTDPGVIDQFTIGSDGTLAPVPANRVGTGRQPYPIAFTPDGKFAVAPNNEDRTISTYRIDGGSIKHVATLSTGKESRSVVVDHAGAFVYAANYDSDSISVYALAPSGELAPVVTVDSGKLPYQIALSPNGKFLYSADRRSGDVTIFSINSSDGTLKFAGNVLTGMGPASGANWIAFDSTGKFAYVTNNTQGSVSQFIVDPNTGMLTRNGDDVTVGAAPIQVAVDPSDRFVYVANSGDNTVSQLRIRHDGSLSPGASVRIHGHAETQVGGAIHLPGSPWTIAFARR